MKNLIPVFSLLMIVSCSTLSPITATSNKVGNAKGEACRRNILFVIPISNDNSIYSAARDGGITKISTVDYSAFTSIIYNSLCTVVHGSKDEPKSQVKSESKVEKETETESDSEPEIVEEPKPLVEKAPEPAPKIKGSGSFFGE